MATLPNPNPVINNAVANYQYSVDPSTTPVNAANISNNVATTINVATTDLTKLTSPTGPMSVGQTISYTLVFKNTGNTTANNIVFTDTIPTDTTFVTDSLKLNGVTIAGGNPTPPTGVNLGTLDANEVATVTFQVTINTIPSPNPIINSGTSNFVYTTDPASPDGSSGSANSNNVSNLVEFANFNGILKSVDKTTAKIGDKLVYTIVLPNNGNACALNIQIIDTIPNDTSFVTNSVTIASPSGVSRLNGASPAPPSGFSFTQTILPGQTGTVTFEVLVLTLPTINPIPNIGIAAIQTRNGSGGTITNNYSTNQVTTFISDNRVSLSKSVSAGYAKVGDVLTYSFTLSNLGNITANNVLFLDTIPNGTSFNSGSVFVNGTPQPSYNPAPPSGFTLGNINPYDSQTITFSVTVTTIPTINPIPDYSYINYTGTADPASPDAIRGNTTSNTVLTQVNQATIDNANGGGLVKQVNSNYAKVGDVLTYTITLKNTGNVAANNVLFTDTTPNDTSFNVGSVFVNLLPDATANPNPPNAVTIPNIAPGATATISYTVTVLTVPNPNPIPNSGTVNYTYTVYPTIPNGESGSGNTNTVNTQVNQATIDVNSGGLTKTVDKAYAKVGDVLLYTLNLNNTGNVAATNVYLLDTIPNGTTFVPNSVTINSIPATGQNPGTNPGVFVGTIPAGGSSVVTFNVVVSTIPTINPIPNAGRVNYTYTLIPTVPNGQSGNGNSNIVNTRINQAVIDNTVGGGLNKAVSPSYADVGDVISYTIGIKNTGNITANSVVFTDTTPNGTNFVTDSVYLNGVNQPGAIVAPPTGLNIGDLGPGASATIVFQVQAFTIPNPNPIPNTGTVNYTYTVDPAQPAENGGGNTNIVNTQINSGNFNNGAGGVTKYVDKTFAKGGDTLTYTIVLTNTGNVVSNNVVLTDTIPAGTTFIPGTVQFNSVTQPSGVVAPPTGFTIGSINPGQSVTVSFKVSVITTPTINPIPNQGKVAYTYTVQPTVPNGKSAQNLTNIVNTNFAQAVIDNTNGGGLTKAVDVQYAQVGQIVNYTIGMINTGNVAANNVVLIDTLPNGVSFVSDSVFLNGLPQPGTTVVPPSGFSVGTIGPGSGQTLTFQVRVNTIPSPNPIVNNSGVTYNYVQDPANPSSTTPGSGLSNSVNTQVNQAFIDNTAGGGFIKYVDKTYAKVGDVLNYTIALKNTGNVAATNVLFSDTIPGGTTFNNGSVIVNGVPQPSYTPNPPSVITIPNINALSTATILFSVTVVTVPTINPIPNSGTVSYNFALIPTIPNSGSGTGNTNTVFTQVNQATIDNNNGGGLVKSVDKAYAKVGDILTYTINLTNTGNVAATNVILTDTTPNNTAFVANSVRLNGTPQTGVSLAPGAGLTIPQILPGSSAQVQFNVTVTTTPTVNPIPNTSTVRYTFTSNPSIPNGSSSSGNSNTVNTSVSQANIDNTNGGGLVKYVDKAFADINEVLQYKIVLKNTGNATAVNITFTDTIPNGTTFEANSVILNGVPQPAVSPDPASGGVPVGNLLPFAVSTITFNVLTTSTIPSPNPIPNSGTVNYNFTVDPAVLNGASGSGNTNTVTTQLNSAIIPSGTTGITKSVNNAYAKVGDTLVYTIIVNNSGNVTANNVVFTDTIPNNTSFITNSVFLNNVLQPGATVAPPTGLNVGNIAPGGTLSVKFSVLVLTIPSPNPIPNQAEVAFRYTTNPAQPNGRAAAALSEFAYTQVNQASSNIADGGLTKSVSRAFAKVNDVLTYTITFNNTGNVAANNVIITDTLPSGTAFIANSVFVNSINLPGANPAPPTGVNIGSVAPLATSYLAYQVIVTTIPTPNPIPNSATANFRFTVIPTIPDGASGSGNTNIVNTQVNQGTIDNANGGGMVKFVNSVKSNFAAVGDVLTYSVALKNTGNVAVNNVFFTDTIPSGTSFTTNVVNINNVPQFGANPQVGVTIPTILPGQVATVSFQVTVITLPAVNPIPNNSTVNYTYTTDPSVPNGSSGSGNSDQVITKVNGGWNAQNGGLTKYVDKAFAKVNDTLKYTIVVYNNGNATLNNIIFKDTIPNGTSFINNTVFVNFAQRTGVNPQSGFTLNPIAPGVSTTIDFNVTVTTIPTINPIPNNGIITFNYTVDPSLPNGRAGGGISNTVNTQVNYASIDQNGGGLVKTVSKTFADVNDVLTYTITLKNTGNVTAFNVLFTDTVPSGTSFNSNTLKQDGVVQPGSDPQTGIVTSFLSPGASTVISFDVTVITIPTPNPIPNSALTSYEYSLDPNAPNTTGKGLSNTVNTRVNNANFNGNGSGQNGINKFVNTNYAAVGDTLTYNIVISNTGNVSASNVVFTDTIPNSTTFVNNSVFVNNSQQLGANPQSGISLGTLFPNVVTTIRFSVVVTTLPTINPIPNEGALRYSYIVDPAQPAKQGANLSNTVNTEVNQATIDNRNGGGLVKSVDQSVAPLNSVLTYTIQVNNTGNVTANNVVLTDTVPNSTTYLPGTATVNGSPVSITSPTNGIPVGSIPPQGSSTVQFQVQITTLPTINPIPNNSTVRYNFTVIPTVPNGRSGSGNSNTVTTRVNTPILDNKTVPGSFTKTGSRTTAATGDIIQYIIVAKNLGNTAANNLVITDTIPNDTTFVQNTVRLNNVIQPGVNPQSGITVGTLNPQGVATITFDVQVGNTIPSPNPIPNSASNTYTYIADPSNPNPTQGGGNTNIFNTQVNSAIIDNKNGEGLVKTVNAGYAKTGEILLYTIAVRNTGNVTANNVVVTDTIPNGTTFVINSVRVNNTTQAGANIQTGVNIGSIGPSNAVTITFNVQVGNTIPNPNPIPNNATASYNFIVDPQNPTPRNSGGNTNTVITQVNSPSMDNTNGQGFTKTGDKKFADIGDIITYYLVLKNTGNVAANNIVVTDTIPNGTSFVSNSLFFNSVNQPGSVIAPPTGFNAGSLNPGAVTTIQYSVQVNTIPTPNPIPNTGTVNYTFTLIPTVPDGATGSGNSGFFYTQVNNGGLNPAFGGFTKYVSNAYAAVGDSLLYTIVAKNTGNSTLNNVVISDTIPNGTTFVSNSVRLNNVLQPGINIQTGVSVGQLTPGNVATITFNVVVNTIPTVNPIPNQSIANYNYIVDPQAPPKQGGNQTNVVNTQVNQATIDNTNGGGLVKSTSPDYVKVGDIITYTINVSNSGNVSANNVVIKDTIPNGTTYVQNSATVNNNPVSITTPTNGIPVGTVGPLQTSVVVFQVVVNTIPTINPIPNNSTATYQFIIDPAAQNPRNGSGNSNTVYNQVNQAQIDNTAGAGLVKYVNTNYADLNDTLNYTLVAKNNGNVTANNVVITDTIPNGTQFIANTVRINGTQQLGSDPQSGINVGNISANSVVTITFSVIVTTIPTPNPIPNSGTSTFNFLVDPINQISANGSGNSNIVNTQINNAGFSNVNGQNGMVKTQSKNYVEVGDTINYQIVLSNTGNSVANNVIFTDTIPNGTSLVPNSVTVNFVGQPAANPQTGVNIGSIAVGGVVTIGFSVTVNTIPVPNPIPNQGKVSYAYTVIPTVPNGKGGQNISNQVFAQVNDPNINNSNGSFVKLVNKTFATLNDIVKYTFVIKNTGNVPATNVVLFDTIPAGLAFVQNTVFLNGVPQPGLNPQTGISQAQLPVGATSTITFDTTVTTIPLVNPIPDTGDLSYNFTIDPSTPNGGSSRVTSNQVNTRINAAIIDNNNGGGMTKSSSPQYADVNDIITYVINMKNTGNVTANNVIIQDTIPSGTQLISSSVLVNGTPSSGNPQAGINVGNVAPGGVASLGFKVLVTTIPSPNPIQNTATSTYSYVVNPNTGEIKNSGGSSNPTNNQINNATIDNTNGGGLVKAADRSVATIGETIVYSITVKNTGNVVANNVVLTDTIPNGTSYVSGSATVNGLPVNVTSPTNGIPVGSVNPGQSVLVQFSVLITSVPSPNPIPNNASVKFTYTVDPSIPNGKTGGGNSNTVLTGLNSAIIDNASGGLRKYVDLAYADLGEQIQYKIVLKNTGTTAANNVILTDTIPNGTTFVNNSVFLNGVNQGSANPQTGINVGSLAPNVVYTVTFNVLVTTIPIPNPIPNSGTVRFVYTKDPAFPDGEPGSGNTNIVNTQVNHGSIVNGDGGFVKYADKTCAGISETINYTIVAKNTGNTSVNNLVIIDTIPNSTSLIPNTVKVNGQVFSGVNPGNGINIGSLGPAAVVTVMFSVSVTSLPSSANVSNRAFASYNYTVNPSNPNAVKASTSTNSVDTSIYSAIISGNNFIKAVDKNCADLGDILTYTLTLRNTGNTIANNVTIFDTIPNGTTFIQNSVTINGATQNSLDPQTGIPLGSLPAGGTAVVTYKVQVSTFAIPTPNPVPNNADVVYEFDTCGGNTVTVRSTTNQG